MALFTAEAWYRSLLLHDCPYRCFLLKTIHEPVGAQLKHVGDLPPPIGGLLAVSRLHRNDSSTYSSIDRSHGATLHQCPALLRWGSGQPFLDTLCLPGRMCLRISPLSTSVRPAMLLAKLSGLGYLVIAGVLYAVWRLLTTEPPRRMETGE